MSRKSKPRLTEIDLSLTTRKGGAGLHSGPTYLALYNGNLHTVWFQDAWFGLTTFSMGFHAQYDPPGTNCSLWERIWLIEFEP